MSDSDSHISARAKTRTPQLSVRSGWSNLKARFLYWGFAATPQPADRNPRRLLPSTSWICTARSIPLMGIMIGTPRQRRADRCGLGPGGHEDAGRPSDATAEAGKPRLRWRAPAKVGKPAMAKAVPASSAGLIRRAPGLSQGSSEWSAAGTERTRGTLTPVSGTTCRALRRL